MQPQTFYHVTQSYLCYLFVDVGPYYSPVFVFIPVCGPIDLVFLLDSSGSIGKENWPKMLTFVKTMSSKLMVGQDRVRIATISFGNEATLHFGLDSYTTLMETEEAIDLIRWKDQYTNTGEALRVMENQVFKVSMHACMNARTYARTHANTYKNTYMQ